MGTYIDICFFRSMAHYDPCGVRGEEYEEKSIIYFRMV